MKVYVTFDIDERYREEEEKAEKAQDLLDKIIYDYQCGMVCVNSVRVESRKFSTKIVKSKK